MTKAQQTYERINALVESGTTKAEAFKQLAEEYGQPVDSVRGAYYGHKRVTEGGGSSAAPRRSRKRETTAQDAIASAVATLEAACASIEIELETARERADEAKAEYEAMQAASGDRIKEIRAKIAVLSPGAGQDAPTGTSQPTAPAAPASAASKPAAKRPARKEAADS